MLRVSWVMHRIFCVVPRSPRIADADADASFSFMHPDQHDLSTASIRAALPLRTPRHTPHDDGTPSIFNEDRDG